MSPRKQKTCATLISVASLAALAPLVTLPFGLSCCIHFGFASVSLSALAFSIHSIHSFIHSTRSVLKNSINTVHADALAKLSDHLLVSFHRFDSSKPNSHFPATLLSLPASTFPPTLPSPKYPVRSWPKCERRSPILAAINYAWFDSAQLALLCFASV